MPALQRPARRRLTLLAAVTLVLATLVGALSAPAAAAPPAGWHWEYRSCGNALECQINFYHGEDTPILFKADANGGPERPIAVSIDVTMNAECHPTIYPSWGEISRSCYDVDGIGGDYRLIIYAGDRHDLNIAVWVYS